MRFDLRGAIQRLKESKLNDTTSDYFANAQAVRQFNYYLEIAKKNYPYQYDLIPIQKLQESSSEKLDYLKDSISRLEDAIKNLTGEETSQNVELSQKFGILRSSNQLNRDFEDLKKDKGGLGLVFFDIDNFKSFNTKYTETKVDDYLLIPLQMFLSDYLTVRGFCYSIGGDEFNILLRNVDKEETLSFAKRLVKELNQVDFQIEGQIENITISAGVASFPFDSDEIDDLKAKANLAENVAKKNGRNQAIAYIKK